MNVPDHIGRLDERTLMRLDEVNGVDHPLISLLEPANVLTEELTARPAHFIGDEQRSVAFALTVDGNLLE